MTQKIIVAVVLILTVALTVRWLVRTLRGKGGCSCGKCPMSGRRDCHCCDSTTRLPDIKV